jgi:hypothetical protein
MNLDQITRLGAFQANAIDRSGALKPFWTMPELLAWANDGNLEIEKMIRSLFDDYFVRKMDTSLDTGVQKLLGITYQPSVTLALPALTSQISLPPDLETLRYIRCVSTGFEFMEFEHKDMNERIFMEYLRVPTSYTVPPGGRIFYDIVGERTLFIAPQVTQPLDIEIRYVSRTKRMVRYLTGTVSVPDTTTGVTGVGTIWSSGVPFDPNYLDIIFGTNTYASVDPSWEYDGVNLARVASVQGDTALTLAAPKVGTVVGGNYILSSVPVIPPEHHHAIADYITAQMLMKAGNPQAAGFTQKFEARKRNIFNTINTRQPDVEYVEDYTTWS